MNTVLGIMLLSLIEESVHSRTVDSPLWYDVDKEMFMYNNTEIGKVIGPALRFMEKRGWE